MEASENNARRSYNQSLEMFEQGIGTTPVPPNLAREALTNCGQHMTSHEKMAAADLTKKEDIQNKDQLKRLGYFRLPNPGKK